MKKLMFTASVTALTSLACVAPGDQNLIFIRGAVEIEPPSCDVNAGTQLFLARGVLDIGDDLTDANGYVNAFVVENTIGERISFDQAEVSFETDVNQQLEGAATPGGGAAPRKSFVGGLVDEFGRSVVFVNTVTEDDALSLQEEPLVTRAGLNSANPERSVRIIARVSIEGHTTKNTFVKSPPFSFPIDLCAGCLTTQIATCPDGTALSVNETCFFGQDTPINACK